MFIAQSEREIHEADSAIATTDQKIQELERQLAEAVRSKAEYEIKKKIAEENVSALKSRKSELEREIQAFVKKDTSEITAKINAHAEKQRVVADMQARKKIYYQQTEKRNELKAEWKLLDDQIKEIETQQNDLVKELDLSYKIKLEDGVMSVFVDDQRIPLDELNTAAQLDLGVDICLS